ncbi:UNVERIFIED_CONTAM: putative ribonuclease H protein [Sesamum calycinum]|uniref:Ribonuclease H protein n=1 Tax=Sesamum calycinum TaxID=2727403 RepID=A0AAW2P8L8_9LAMI
MNKYCKANTPATAKVSRNDSPIWSKLCKVRYVAQTNMFWSLGKGEVSFWNNCWLQEGPLYITCGHEESEYVPVNWFWSEEVWKPENLRGDAFATRLVKLNTDGASKGNPGVAGAGGIVRDYEGKVILAFSEPIGFTNNMVDEMHVVLRGFGICLEKGFSKVWFECSSCHSSHIQAS